MADTMRCIYWSLERPCSLRSGEGWALPNVTYRQLADVSTYCSCLPDGMVVDDICVTGYTFATDNAENSVILPSSGFRVSLGLAPFGGEAAVRTACGACEANVSFDNKPMLAGCHGYLDVLPDSAKLESKLREKVRLKGMEADHARHFPRTTPLWYGFWINSPLRRSQCEVLLALLEGIEDHAETWLAGNRRFLHFLAALRVAIDRELPLHVEMAKPGHSDLGWDTIFPHCPRCKAPAPVPRWQESYPDKSIDCPICGHSYSPAKTHKAERIDEADWFARDLANILRPGEIEGFRRRFLAHRGFTNEQIDDILDRENNGPLKRRISELRRKQKVMRRSLSMVSNRSDTLPNKLVLGLGGSVSMCLRLVRAGEFLMGTAGLPEEVENEGPQHLVRVAAPFYLGEFPVTQAQFAAVMSGNPSRFKEDSDRPVEGVSWFMAQEFCLQVSRKTRRRVRLPSEAEWEYSCRAGAKTKFHWGDEETTEFANYKAGDPAAAIMEGTERGTTTNVQGRFPPNAWGIFDMHGNVQEWCDDEWHNDYAGAPTNGSAWITPGDENPFRPLRGGSCWHHASACTAAARQKLRADTPNKPQDALPEDDLIGTLFCDRATVGFRVVVEVE